MDLIIYELILGHLQCYLFLQLTKMNCLHPQLTLQWYQHTLFVPIKFPLPRTMQIHLGEFVDHFKVNIPKFPLHHIHILFVPIMKLESASMGSFICNIAQII